MPEWPLIAILGSMTGLFQVLSFRRVTRRLTAGRDKSAASPTMTVSRAGNDRGDQRGDRGEGDVANDLPAR